MTIRDHPLAWRWTDSRYALLPESTLAQIEPVDLSKAEYLFRHSLRLLGRDCLSPEVFETVTRSRADIPIEAGCAWLRAQQPDLSARIYVSWEASIAVQTTWEIFSGYWDDFCYPSSDDVVVWPESENWALLYHHEQEFQFGRTRLV
jgi:hypothetical protein